MTARGSRLRSALGWVVSLAVIAAIGWAVEWRDVAARLGQARPILLVPLTLVGAVHFLLRALRWRYILPGPHETPFRALNDTLMLGNMATFLLPLRAGEILRPLLLSRRSAHPFPVAFVSIVIERFFDLSAVLLLFGLLVLFVPDVPDLAFTAAALLGVLAMTLLGVVLVGGFRPAWVLAACRLMLRPLPAGPAGKILTFIDHLLDGARVLRDPANLARVVGLTSLVWLTNHAYFLVGLWMFGVADAAWPALAVVVMVALAVAFPSAPGFLGVFQAGCVVALALFGLDDELAVAFSLVLHAHLFVYICGYGAVLLGASGLGFGALRSSARTSDR